MHSFGPDHSPSSATYDEPDRRYSRRRPRLLFVDAYDSFSNNVIGLLEKALEADVVVLRIDHDFGGHHLPDLLACFDAVVVGPGPGDPNNVQDVGLIPKLWQMADGDLIPVLGICLGHQSLALAFGARVKRLAQPRHGLIHKIQHNGTDMFIGARTLSATQYHSLHVDLGLPHNVRKDDPRIWQPTSSCPNLQPLAWDWTDSRRPVLMALRHLSKPFWSMQFHPESCCSSPKLLKVVQTWWRLAEDWLQSREDRSGLLLPRPLLVGLTESQQGSLPMNSLNSPAPTEEKPVLRWRRTVYTKLDVCDLVEELKQSGWDVILLDSQGHSKGRHAILGVVDSETPRGITYSVSSRELTVRNGNETTKQLDVGLEEVWELLQSVLDRFQPEQSGLLLPEQSPFWGGWMGYISYEAGLDSIAVQGHASGNYADVNFVFVERSIVVDLQERYVYMQTIRAHDLLWLGQVEAVIGTYLKHAVRPECRVQAVERVPATSIARPSEMRYRLKVLKCQDALRAGHSYELCLTDLTKVAVPATVESWSIYTQLRRTNPAPFGAHMPLPGVTIVGSSPERFLSWNRNGRCRMEPIKGTVKKTPEMTLQKAMDILNTSKECAENLMIVDLIRHDLSGVCGAKNVNVDRLMQVEEYETVYQLVSVIEAQLPQPGSGGPASAAVQPTTPKRTRSRGLDVLKASLPPGSMTGAPKKHSCEILTKLEGQPRGIYSGVLGYMDVGGAGDFSVVIRSMFHASSDVIVEKETGKKSNVWHIGAGGAVTVQSTDKGEFDEMETKLESVLQVFDPSA